MKPYRFAALAAVGLALAACRFGGDAKEIDAGTPVERDIAVGTFQKVAVSGPYDVDVQAGGKPGVHVSGGENFLNASEFVVEDGTLKIRTKEKNIRWSWNDQKEKVHVTVTGAAGLLGAGIAGSGNVRIDAVKSASFDGDVAGSGNLDVGGIETGAASFSIAGSGNVKAAGKAQSVKLEIAGSGDIDGEGLLATDAELSIAGSGNISAHATGNAKASIMGSGDISVTGGAKCEINKTGSGSVRCS